MQSCVNPHRLVGKLPCLLSWYASIHFISIPCLISLAYNQLLSLFTGVAISVAARKIPNLYNETRWISFSTYNLSFCLIIGVVVPIFLQAIDSVAFFVVSACGIGFGFIGFWLLMFGPKLYLIYFNPEKLKELSYGSGSSTRTNFGSSKMNSSSPIPTRSYTQPTRPNSSGKEASTSGKKSKPIESKEESSNAATKEVAMEHASEKASSGSNSNSSSSSSSSDSSDEE